VKLLASLLAAAALCGCVYTGKNGVKTHVIIGFGVVQTGSTNETAGTVSTIQALGAYLGNGTASLGCLTQTRVELKTNSNVILEIKK
jgi:hypothetical protein